MHAADLSRKMSRGGWSSPPPPPLGWLGLNYVITEIRIDREWNFLCYLVHKGQWGSQDHLSHSSILGYRPGSQPARWRGSCCRRFLQGRGSHTGRRYSGGSSDPLGRVCPHRWWHLGKKGNLHQIKCLLHVSWLHLCAFSVYLWQNLGNGC